jgi:hypothetical protein
MAKRPLRPLRNPVHTENTMLSRAIRHKQKLSLLLRTAQLKNNLRRCETYTPLVVHTSRGLWVASYQNGILQHERFPPPTSTNSFPMKQGFAL